MQSKQWEHVSESAKDLVTRLLCLNQHERITITEALAHPWIRVSEREDESKQSAAKMLPNR